MQLAATIFDRNLQTGEVVARIASGSTFCTQGEFLETMAREHFASPYITRDGKFWGCRETGRLMSITPIHSGSAS